MGFGMMVLFPESLVCACHKWSPCPDGNPLTETPTPIDPKKLKPMPKLSVEGGE
jgi:hypothetical protein